MRNKKIFMYIGIIIIVIVLLGVGYIIYNNSKNKKQRTLLEYIPEPEITEEQLRQTVIMLYFLDSYTYQLIPEARQIDAKQLVTNPSEILVNLLINGPKNEKLIKLIPENTKLNSSVIQDNTLCLDFSKEFIEGQNLGKEQEELIIKSIVNTVTELTEINQVEILIDGEKNSGFPDGNLIFNKIFTKE